MDNRFVCVFKICKILLFLLSVIYVFQTVPKLPQTVDLRALRKFLGSFDFITLHLFGVLTPKLSFADKIS